VHAAVHFSCLWQEPFTTLQRECQICSILNLVERFVNNRKRTENLPNIAHQTEAKAALLVTNGAKFFHKNRQCEQRRTYRGRRQGQKAENRKQEQEGEKAVTAKRQGKRRAGSKKQSPGPRKKQKSRNLK